MTLFRPLAPLDTAPLFPEVGRELVALLRGLAPEDWRRPTVCPAWSVQDVAAHLLDTALRRASAVRDRYALPPPERPIDSYAALVTFLNDMNASWVAAFRRVSPRLLVDLVEIAEPALAETFSGLDPDAPALGVAWAGEDTSPVWFDVARELTERWHHQQQIRLAVGAPPLDAPHLVEPVLETFLRALPHRYAALEAPAATALAIAITGRARYDFTLLKTATGWAIGRGTPDAPAAAIRSSDETAWLLLTKGLPGAVARERSQVEGDERLLAPWFATLAVMA